MGISEEDLQLLDNYSQTVSIYCYDKVAILLAKYTFEEWDELMNPDSMAYWITVFGIVDWIQYMTPEMFDNVHEPSPKNTIETIIIMYKKICNRGYTDYAEKMALLAIPTRTTLSEILQLNDLTGNRFGSINRFYKVFLHGDRSYYPIYNHANLMDLLISMGYRSNDFYLAYEYDGELIDTDNKNVIHAREQYQLYCIERMKSY